MWPYDPAPWTTTVSGPAAAASSRARRDRSGPRRVRYFDFTVITEPPSFTRSMESRWELGRGLKACTRPTTVGGTAAEGPVRGPDCRHVQERGDLPRKSGRGRWEGVEPRWQSP